MSGNSLAERIFQRVQEMGIEGDLARYSGLEPSRLQAIQNGDPFSASEYEQLCRAVAVDPVAMYRGEETRPQRIPARFRAATSLDSPDASDVRILAMAAEMGRILAHLVGMQGEEIAIARHRKILGVGGSAEPWREGYALGEQARGLLRSESGPVHELERLLNDLGVHIARIALSSTDVDAASIWEPGAVPVILLNRLSKRKHPGALRATLAHELCHLLHDAGEGDITTMVSWGTEQTGNYSNAVEMRARAFSPSFLAPRSQVLGWARELGKAVREDDDRLVYELASHWGLSFEGAAWHAKNCDLIRAESAEDLARRPRKPRISYELFETVQTDVPPAMFHDLLPEDPAPLWQGWAAGIVIVSMEEGQITTGRARELLTWS
ncbi:MAG: ImmA/IrrE family metallo-endopeptidase [Deltaproteobacteria bacterium]|nr:ImmA/IrrE family metallo-endopeptidase [Deltaproteobacteria bacterium]